MEAVKELIKKYDKAGPRYTSYPTAPHFSMNCDASVFSQGLKKIKAGEPISLYVHIPFCKSQCYFCGCNMLVSTSTVVSDQYVNVLCKEIELVGRALKGHPVSQFHWGGGTPSLLSTELMRKIFDHVRSHIGDFSPGAEISIEVHPSVMTREKTRDLKALGFNRISMGVQDFDESVQKEIRRIQTYEQTFEVIDEANKLGFLSTNVDLVYGLPKSRPETFHKTVLEIIKLKPGRVALFNYAHVPWLKPYQRFLDENSLPKGDEKLNIFMSAREEFLKSGYESIGMDHFALPDDELTILKNTHKLHRNFMGYTALPTKNLVGLGMTSISELETGYFQNQKKLKDYYLAVERGEYPTIRGVELSVDDKIRRDVIMTLMCDFRISWGKLKECWEIDPEVYFQKELQKLTPAVEDGLCLIGEDGIVVTKIGELFVRNIAMAFDAYLVPKTSEIGARMYSRTI